MSEIINNLIKFQFKIFILSLFIFLVIYWLFVRRQRFSIFERLGIPGPKPNLFTGNLTEFFQTSNVEFHSRLLDKYGPAVGYYLGSKPIILIKHIGILKEIQMGKQSKNFEERPRLVPGGINPSVKRSKMLGNLPVHDWRDLRKTLNKCFTLAKIKQMIPLINESIDIFINKLQQNIRKELDFYDLFQKLALDIIGRTAFGVDTEVQTNQNDVFLLAVKQEFSKKPNSLTKFSLCFPEFFFIIQRIRKSIEFLKEFLRLSSTSKLWELCKKTLLERRSNENNNRKDLLQYMIEANLADDVIIAQSVLFFEAAFETLSASLAFIVHILLNYEDDQDRMALELTHFSNEFKTGFDFEILKELNLMESVIAETLRLFPPQTTFISRCNSESDFCFDDPDTRIVYIIPKGIQIQVALYQIQRDPNNYNEPEQFQSERFIDSNPMKTNGENAIKWQAFGEGSRHCIGKLYARLVLKLIISKLLSKFKIIKTKNTEKMDKLKIEYKTATMTPAVGVFGAVVLKT